MEIFYKGLESVLLILSIILIVLLIEYFARYSFKTRKQEKQEKENKEIELTIEELFNINNSKNNSKFIKDNVIDLHETTED